MTRARSTAHSMVLVFLAFLCPVMGHGAGLKPAAPARILPETLTVAVPENSGITVRRFQIESDGSLTQSSRTRVTDAAAQNLLGLHFAPDGKVAYVEATENGKYVLSQFQVAADGSLALVSAPPVSIGAAADPRSTDPLTFSPDGHFAYALCEDGIHQYKVQPDDALVPLAVAVVQTGQPAKRPDVRTDVSKPGDGFVTYQVEHGNFLSPLFLAFDHSGHFAYAINHEYYYKGMERVTSFEVSGGGTDVDNSRTLAEFRVGKDGTLTLVGTPLPVALQASSINVSPTGRVLSVAGGGISLFPLSADGSISARPAQTLPGEVSRFDASGSVLYVSQHVGTPPPGLAETSEITQYRLDARATATQIGSPVPLPKYGSDATQMMLDRTGRFLLCYYYASVFVHAIQPDGPLGNEPASSTPSFEWPGTLSLSPRAPALAAAPPVAVPASGPDPHEFAYVLNADADTISQYAVGGSGTLIPLTPPAVKLGQIWGWHMAVDPTGRFLYVPHALLRTLDQFRIADDGTLTPLATPTIMFPAPDVPSDAKVDPSGRILYVSDANSPILYMFHIQPDGSLTPSPDQAKSDFPRISNWTINAMTHLLAVHHDNDDLDTYRMETDGTLTHLAHTQTYLGQPLTFTPNGRFAYYGTTYGEVWQFRVSPEGVVTENNPRSVPADNSPRGIAVTPDGRFAYAVDQGDFNVPEDGGVSQYRVGDDGTLTALLPTTLMTKTDPYRAVVDPAGRFFYALSPGVISPFRIGTDGRLVPLPVIAISAGQIPDEMAIVRR